MKILLLEDEVMLNESIMEYLESQGHIVDIYFDGLEAYEAIKNNSYDFFILDINVPGMDGLTFLEKTGTYPTDIIVVIILKYPGTFKDGNVRGIYLQPIIN